MKRKNVCFQVLLILLTIASGHLSAQVLKLEPHNPSLTDTVRIIFNAAEGNQGLKDYQGDVYFHTGLITDKSNDIHSWKHVVGNWGVEDESLQMKALGNNLYSCELVIQSFYNVREEEEVQQIAIVFRNGDGTLVGKTADEQDIVVPVNAYIPQPKIDHTFKNSTAIYQSHTFIGNDLLIETNNFRLEIQAFSDEIIHISYLDKGKSRADSSVAVIMKPEDVEMILEDGENCLKIKSGIFNLLINKNPFRIFVMDAEENLLIEEEIGYYTKETSRGLRFKIEEGEKFYGLGERAINFALNGHKYQLYNKPFYGYGIGATDLNYSVPVLMSSKKYMLLLDNPQKGTVDVGSEEKNILDIEHIGGVENYYIISGDKFNDITKDYFQLTGTQDLPPRWAFGNLMSRMAYRTQNELDSIVNLMEEKKFPIDAVIIDFYWFGDSIKGTLGRLKWYKPNWPEPEEMIQKFKKKGIKTILITEPYVLDSLDNWKELDQKGLLSKKENGESYIDYGFYFGNGSLIDIFKPEAGEWFWTKYKAQIEKGVAAWWGDLGEPESHPSDIYHILGKADEVHNIYGHYWHKMLYEKYRTEYPDVRLFNLNRAGYAGSQRYSIFPWSGDVGRSWGGYQAQLPVMLHMSMSGLPYIHADAGGFAQGVLDEELYTRWLQFACFTPVLRPHGSGIPSEPVYFSQKTQDIVRKYMNMRYALLPYIYTNAWETATHGDLLIEPVFYHDDSEDFLISEQQSYFFGDNLLVFPVLEKAQTSMDVSFPHGSWYNIFNNTLYEESKATIPITLDDMPVFAKGGSFIPTVIPVSSTEKYSSAFLNVSYYWDDHLNESNFTMYEDDGKSNLSWENDEFELIYFSYTNDQGKDKILVQHNDGNYKGMPEKRWINLRIIGNQSFEKASINMSEIQLVDDLKSVGNSEQGFYYDAEGFMNIYFEWDYNDIEILFY